MDVRFAERRSPLSAWLTVSFNSLYVKIQTIKNLSDPNKFTERVYSKMDYGLKDKVVLITGSTGGIGQALCRAFAAEGTERLSSIR